jgi:hypothetical protein
MSRPSDEQIIKALIHKTVVAKKWGVDYLWWYTTEKEIYLTVGNDIVFLKATKEADKQLIDIAHAKLKLQGLLST